jgi:hypothetical protein
MIRSSSTEPSKEFLARDCKENGSLLKSKPSFFHWLKLKFKNFISGTFSKAITYIALVSFFSWFGFNVKDIASGVVSVLHGDMSGIATIANSANFKRVMNEAYQIVKGEDDTWSVYEKEKGFSLKEDFVYIGNGASITKSVITLAKVDKTCDITKELDVCGFPAISPYLEEAKEMCANLYGASLPTYKELQNAIGGINPFNFRKIDKFKSFPEMTSTLNQSNNDEFKVFYKSFTQENDLSENYALADITYIEEDSPLLQHIAFRCYIKL